MSMSYYVVYSNRLESWQQQPPQQTVSIVNENIFIYWYLCYFMIQICFCQMFNIFIVFMCSFDLNFLILIWFSLHFSPFFPFFIHPWVMMVRGITTHINSFQKFHAIVWVCSMELLLLDEGKINCCYLNIISIDCVTSSLPPVQSNTSTNVAYSPSKLEHFDEVQEFCLYLTPWRWWWGGSASTATAAEKGWNIA